MRFLEDIAVTRESEPLGRLRAVFFLMNEARE